MIKNIVFDFGGVIADISREQAVKAFIRLGVKDADRILDKYHQTGIFQELEEGSLTEEAYRNELGKLCGRTLSWEEVQQAWLGFITGVDIRKLEYLEMLRSEGYKLYVLSNTNPYVMGWACANAFFRGQTFDIVFRQVIPLLSGRLHKTRTAHLRIHAVGCRLRTERNLVRRRWPIEHKHSKPTGYAYLPTRKWL
mgnify:CR=1 FL=1